MTPLRPVPETRRVMIALPWYRSANPLTAFSLLMMMDRRRFGLSLSFGDAFIVHARNKLATEFLASDFEWLLTVDDDMILPAGNAALFNQHSGLNLPEKFAGLHTINRLLSHEKTLVGATYYGRAPGGKPVFAEGKKMQAILLEDGPEDSVRPTRWVGTGCLLIHRKVFLDIEEKFPHLSRANNNGTGQWFTSSEHDLRQEVENTVEFLSHKKSGASGGEVELLLRQLTAAQHKSSIHSALGVGEDVQFCVRATQSGHQPHIDLGLWCGHVGSAIYPNKA